MVGWKVNGHRGRLGSDAHRYGYVLDHSVVLVLSQLSSSRPFVNEMEGTY